MKRGALLLTLVSYLGCILVLGTEPELLLGTSADYAYVPVLITIIFLGSYWTFRWVRPGNIGRFFTVLAILFLIVGTTANIEASPTGTRNQSAGNNQVTTNRYRDYARNCLLTPVPQSSQSSSGYRIVSFGKSEVYDQGNCNGVGYVDASVRASGIYGRAEATSILTFVDQGIFPATNSSAQSYILDARIDFLLNGWQTFHNVGFPVASSTITMSVEFDVIDEKGNIAFDVFGGTWQGPQNLATGEYQLSYIIGLVPGHIYSAALKFTETATVAVYGIAGDASAAGCFHHYTSSCSTDPFLDTAFFCPATTGTGSGPCQDIGWRFMTFSLTAV